MTLIVFLASALLCVGDRCYPALVGQDTPVGRSFALDFQQWCLPGDLISMERTAEPWVKRAGTVSGPVPGGLL